MLLQTFPFVMELDWRKPMLNVWCVLLFKHTTRVTQRVQRTFTKLIEPLQTMKHYFYIIHIYVSADILKHTCLNIIKFTIEE